MNKSEQLIACLEGEIAKRDARIMELEAGADSLRLSRDYHHEHEIDYRRRWSEVSADLEAASSMLVATSKAGIQLRAELSAAKETISRYETTAENCDLLRAELAAIKAQEPVAWRYKERADDQRSAWLYVKKRMHIPGGHKFEALYAAPVSEAKAQGVVQWPEADEIMQMAFEEGQPADDASGYCFELEEFDLFIERLMSEVARLNAAPVQQVSVPDGSRLVTTDWLKRINRDLDACQKLIWANLRGCDPSYYEDAQERLREIDAMLAAAPAAPAAPAADAGYVFYGMDGDHP